MGGILGGVLQREEFSKRNTGIDIIRIIAMLGIVILHVLGVGGVLNATDIHGGNYWVSWFIEICAYTSVDIFAIMTGWLSSEKKQISTLRIIDLISQVLFYGILITGIVYLVSKNLIVETGLKGIVSDVFPLYSGSYWYILCYTGLFFLIPFLNRLVQNTNKELMKGFLIVVLVGSSVVSSLVHLDFYSLSYGYSTFWLVICYVLGAFLKKYNSELFVRRELVVFFLGAAMLVAIRFVVCFMLNYETDWMLSYNSPIILAMATALFMLFARKNYSNNKTLIKRAIASISVVSFDVFLIHCHPVIFNSVIAGFFAWIASENMFLIIVYVLASAIVIYSVCTIVGLFRRLLYRLLLIDRLLKRIATVIDDCLIDKIYGFDERK